MTDDVEEKKDRMIADHVLRMHRYLAPGVEEGTPCQDNLTQPLSVDGPNVAAEAEGIETSPYEKFDPLLHMGFNKSSGRETRSTRGKRKEILSIAFVKKYIQYAKSKPAPALTKGAADHIVQVYATLRNEDMEGTKKVRRHTLPVSLVCSLLTCFILPDVPANCTYPRNTYSSSYSPRQG